MIKHQLGTKIQLTNCKEDTARLIRNESNDMESKSVVNVIVE